MLIAKFKIIPMKKITGLLFILLLTVSVFAQEPETPPVRLDRISDNLYQVSGGRGTNGGMYIGDDAVLIIDSKMDKASVEGIYKTVLETTDKPIIYLVNTHSDGDQVFLGRPQLIHSYKSGNSFEYVKTTQRMLDELDAEKFCSGHAEIMTRADIKNHIKKMDAFQEKVKTLIANGKSLKEVQAEFEENEGRLAESVYNEIIKMN